MTKSTNRQILLVSRPEGEATPDNFKLVETDVPEPGQGEMLLRTIYLSLDPYMRGRMNAGGTYAAGVDLGEVMIGGSVCRVVKSNIPEYQTDDIVAVSGGWQDYFISNGSGARKIDKSLQPASYALGLLGMPSFTAYVGLLNIGKPKAGETVVVAAASGAVGSVVGQIAKIKGCRIVGIAGGAQKCNYVKEELGFDECLDHTQSDLAERLKKACPKGIDVYFENVGGHVFDAVFPLLNNFARIPVCGVIAHYNDSSLKEGHDRLPLLMQNILFKRLSFQGFIVGDYASQFNDFMKDMTDWLNKGSIKYREDVTDGLENAPSELIRLLRGENFGKKIIKVAGD